GGGIGRRSTSQRYLKATRSVGYALAAKSIDHLRPVAQVLDLGRGVDGSVLYFDGGLGPVLGRQALPGDDRLLQILKPHPSARMFQRRRLLRVPVGPALTVHVAHP